MKVLSSFSSKKSRRSHHCLLGLVSALSFAIAASCDHPDPAVPESANTTLTGTWTGSATRSPCRADSSAEDWSSILANLRQSGQAVSGDVTSADGSRHSLSGTMNNTSAILDVGDLPGTSTCGSFQLYINSFQYDTRGNLIELAGTLGGRCCGTVAGTFRLLRQSGA